MSWKKHLRVVIPDGKMENAEIYNEDKKLEWAKLVKLKNNEYGKLVATIEIEEPVVEAIMNGYEFGISNKIVEIFCRLQNSDEITRFALVELLGKLVTYADDRLVCPHCTKPLNQHTGR